MDWPAFLASTILVLFVPGPTNTLLATAGASLRVHKALRLAPVEVSAYALSITFLVFVIGPTVALSPLLGVLGRAGCVLWLVYSAWRLWHLETGRAEPTRTVRVRDVFVTTMLNPKGLLFAFFIFPTSSEILNRQFLVHLGAFGITCITIGSCWILAGTFLKGEYIGYISPKRVQRTAAIILWCFAALLSLGLLGSPGKA
jgi:threonine/homoserine/homoserine lactone efflux protein